MAEVPKGGAKLERVLGCASGRGVAVGDQAGEGFVELFGQQGGTELDRALDVGCAGVPFRVGYPGGDDDGIAGAGQVLLAVEGETGFAGE